jgi:glucarate dehydratase
MSNTPRLAGQEERLVMRISAIRCRTISIPIEAPICHCVGVHQNFTRSIIEVFTEDGRVGLGEATGDVTPAAVAHADAVLKGQNPFESQRLLRLAVTTQSRKSGGWGYHGVNPKLLAGLEIALLDLQAKAVDLPLYAYLGGKARDKLPMIGYLFYRLPTDNEPAGVQSAEAMVRHTRKLIDRFGFKTLKLKGGYLDPNEEVCTCEALREAFGPYLEIRFDPNGAWSVPTAIRLGKRLEKVNLEWYEDPCVGIEAMAAVRSQVHIPLATNMCVTSFPQVGAAFAAKALDVILGDIWYWGGVANVLHLAKLCESLGFGTAMHSGVEFGIGLAAMLHTAAVVPNMPCAVDAHYHHLLDDVITGGPLEIDDGCMRPPDGPGLGVRLDEQKMAKYEKAHQAETAAPMGPPDPSRPDWIPLLPLK